jgi:hypothetical protein
VAYVAMSRGAQSNIAYVSTTSPKTADPRPGSRPTPELMRLEELERERLGFESAPSTAPKQREELAVLADVLERDDTELAASELTERNLAQPDNLAILNAMWQGKTSVLREQAYPRIVLAALPQQYQDALKPTAKWLYRTLRAAVAAGLDVEQLVTSTVRSSSLTGARVTTVRKALAPLVADGLLPSRLDGGSSGRRRQRPGEVSQLLRPWTCAPSGSQGCA